MVPYKDYYLVEGELYPSHTLYNNLGSRSRTRTYNAQIQSLLDYQLSYPGIPALYIVLLPDVTLG